MITELLINLIVIRKPILKERKIKSEKSKDLTGEKVRAKKKRVNIEQIRLKKLASIAQECVFKFKDCSNALNLAVNQWKAASPSLPS